MSQDASKTVARTSAEAEVKSMGMSRRLGHIGAQARRRSRQAMPRATWLVEATVEAK